jgi:RNA polymerase sigma factor (sigma-70 family)
VEKNNYPELSDQDLLDRYFLTKDSQYLGVLLERHTLLLYGICMKYLKNAEEARDTVQRVMLKVIEEVGKYKIDYFRSWMYMIAVNCCHMQLRSRQRLFREVAETDKVITPEDSPAPDEPEEMELLFNAMNQLKTAQKVCLRKFYLEKLSYIEIARETRYTLNEVKSHIQNGKRNLKILMERERTKGEK